MRSRMTLIPLIELRVRSLYPYEAQRPEDLSEWCCPDCMRVVLIVDARLWRKYDY